MSSRYHGLSRVLFNDLVCHPSHGRGVTGQGLFFLFSMPYHREHSALGFFVVFPLASNGLDHRCLTTLPTDVSEISLCLVTTTKLPHPFSRVYVFTLTQYLVPDSKIC